MGLTPDCQAENCALQPLPSPADLYHPLTPEDCQCRAATNAAVANMVALEEHWAQVTIECDSRTVARNLCMQRDLFELHNADVRNRSAATALEAYYQLAGLEAKRHYLDLALEETRRSVERAEKIRDAGLPEGVDRDELAAQLVELEDRRLQMDFARLQLNGRLQKLMGCPITERDFFLPQMDWTPRLDPIDPDAEVQATIDGRFDLRSIGMVLCTVEKSTLRVARGVLQVADAALGSVEPTEGWVHRLRCIACSDHEVDVRCRQLAMLYQDKQQLAEAEIKEAAYEVVLQQNRVVLARSAVDQRRKRLYELSAKRDADDVSVFELSRAKSRMFEAESSLIDQSVSLKIAEVRLKRAEARLASECGFEPKLCWDGCCDGACTHCQAPTCCREDDCPCEKCRRLK